MTTRPSGSDLLQQTADGLPWDASPWPRGGEPVGGWLAPADRADRADRAVDRADPWSLGWVGGILQGAALREPASLREPAAEQPIVRCLAPLTAELPRGRGSGYLVRVRAGDRWCVLLAQGKQASSCTTFGGYLYDLTPQATADKELEEETLGLLRADRLQPRFAAWQTGDIYTHVVADLDLPAAENLLADFPALAGPLLRLLQHDVRPWERRAVLERAGGRLQDYPRGVQLGIDKPIQRTPRGYRRHPLADFLETRSVCLVDMASLEFVLGSRPFAGPARVDPDIAELCQFLVREPEPAVPSQRVVDPVFQKAVHRKSPRIVPAHS